MALVSKEKRINVKILGEDKIYNIEYEKVRKQFYLFLLLKGFHYKVIKRDWCCFRC